MTASHASAINHLRRRLRGLPHLSMMAALRDWLEALDVSALAADNTGRYVAANAHAAALTGYTLDELLRMSVADLMRTMHREASEESWREFIQTGAQAGDYVLKRRDGAAVPVHYAAYASVAPGVHVSLLSPREMTSTL